jgi:hypothetical protein
MFTYEERINSERVLEHIVKERVWKRKKNYEKHFWENP